MLILFDKWRGSWNGIRLKRRKRRRKQIKSERRKQKAMPPDLGSGREDSKMNECVMMMPKSNIFTTFEFPISMLFYGWNACRFCSDFCSFSEIFTVRDFLSNHILTLLMSTFHVYTLNYKIHLNSRTQNWQCVYIRLARKSIFFFAVPLFRPLLFYCS